jgi:ABC-type multidrug transport system fused ATPase/permease subunit
VYPNSLLSTSRQVLLLDEATSALDTQSEQIIQQALDRLVWQAAMTTVVVAHRLNTVRLADCIAVVEAGRLVEQGTHDQLMLRPGGATAS